MEGLFFFASVVVCGCSVSDWWLVVAMVGGGRQCWVEKERDRGYRDRERERKNKK